MKNRVIRGLLLSSILSSAPLLAQSAAPAEAPKPAVDAQAADQGDAGEVVVTGIRQSLKAARDIKRDSTQFLDSVVADDIGKLPDRNVAESLARVSGVQVDRGIGEGTNVSVRGLRQNVFLFNGRQIVDATGRGGTGLDTLASSTYGILALVPSELISRLDVTKLAGADQIAGALGGIVDIQTRMPLDGPNQIAAKVAGTYSDQARKGGAEGFVLASHKFADDTLGVLLSASYDHRNLSQQGLDTFSGYSRYTDAGGVVRYGNSDARPEQIQERRNNLGLDGVVQWKPSSSVQITADTFYSKLDSKRDRWWLSFTPTAGLTNATYSPNNILLSGTATGPVLTNTEFADTKADTWSSAIKGKFNVTDHLHGSAEIAYDRSTSSARQIYFRLQPVVGINPTVNFDFTDGALGSYKISGINLSDPSQLRFTILFDNDYRAISKDKAARTDWTYDIGSGFLKSIDVGGRYDRDDSVQNPLRADIRPTGGIPATQLGEYLTTHTQSHFASGDFEGLPRTYLAAASNVDSCSAFTDVPSISQNAQCLDPVNNTNALSSTFEIKERFLEGYGKIDFGTDIGLMNLSGNVGVRYVDRKLASIGNLISSSGAATPTTFRRTDGDWLPSGVAKLKVSDDVILRAGAAKVVAFPNTADLNNGVTLSNNAVFVNGVQTVLGTGSGGAPNLDPFKANQVDLSAEYYFGKQAMVSVGLFYKDVSTFIVQKQSAESYGGVNYLINRKINGEGAKVKGIEGLVQLPFYFLPSPFDGFGVLATYSYIDSSTPIKDAAGRTLAFPGLSKNNANLVGYYEKGPFSLRVAYNWRDNYLVALSAAATGIYNDSYTDLSATVRYDIMKNVSLGFEANNILNEKQRTYDGAEEGLRTNVFFGRIYKASVSVKF
ncbi:MAG TPA: TonB-dependent receptor [Sphingomonas sp.]|uniref:TonB-dependent receptor n=1 Tax=Sphingomonas sp. TaxID=28214 RepID=UPI002CCB4A20|nr:TonB-dependent receptor [Sphingomonas sp.]HMI18892.1 TonB-dependent receptor [Sphingomonas sp.]